MASSWVREMKIGRQGSQGKGVNKAFLSSQGQKSNSNYSRNQECGVCGTREQTEQPSSKKRGLLLSHGNLQNERPSATASCLCLCSPMSLSSCLSVSAHWPHTVSLHLGLFSVMLSASASLLPQTYTTSAPREGITTELIT